MARRDDAVAPRTRTCLTNGRPRAQEEGPRDDGCCGGLPKLYRYRSRGREAAFRFVRRDQLSSTPTPAVAGMVAMRLMSSIASTALRGSAYFATGAEREPSP